MALHLAYGYKDALQREYIKFLESGRAVNYIFGVHADYDVKTDTTSWNMLEFVSVSDTGVLLGYFHAGISRAEPKVSSLSVMRLTGERSFTFSRDFYSFCDKIFHDPQFIKVQWTAFTDTENERMYDRLYKKYGARIVGIKKKDIRDLNGNLRNVKIYEYFYKKRSNHARVQKEK